jgi:hypothetical protein
MYSFVNILMGLVMLFSNSDEELVSIRTIMRGDVAAKGALGVSQKGRTIEAWYFPGTSNKNALVIGGMHGSELSSVEVANDLIKQLQQERPYYNVIVIPCLFPDNAEAAMNDPHGVGSTHNTGRYTHDKAPDPNRQMPSPGKAFSLENPFDHLGRTIERENQLLLELIAQFKPTRIANLHAIRDTAHAGIYADPRTDSKSIALGFDTDSSLAVNMALHIIQQGGSAPGNRSGENLTALYYKDPPVAEAGQLQKRNTNGSNLPFNRGKGISLGSWASTAVEDEAYPQGNRAAIRLLTIEFPGYKQSKHYADSITQQDCAKNVKLYASALMNVFLGDHYTEE